MVKILLGVLFPLFCFGSLTDVDRQEIVIKNLLNSTKNGGFENDKYNWQSTGAGSPAFAIATSGTELLVGKGSATWDSGGSSDVLQSPTVTIPKGYYGKPGVAYCLIRTPSGAATHTLSVWDGSATVSAGVAITSSTTPSNTYNNFMFPASGTLAIRINAVASNEPSITVDECYIGLANNISQVNQATFYGSQQIPGATNCDWSRNSTGTEGVFSADTDCSVPVLGGNANTTAGKTPGISFPSLPPGHYSVTITYTTESPTSSDCRWYITDGTTHGDYGAEQAPIMTTISRHADFNYTTLQGATQFQLAVRHVSGGSGCIIHANSSLSDGHAIVYRYPSTAETIYTPEVNNWYLDSKITGSPTLSSTDVTTLTAIEDASLAMVLNTGSITAQIPCSSTNPSTGLTCAAGSEQIGAVINVPAAQTIEICADMGVEYDANSSGNMYDKWAWFETSNTTQTPVLQDCGPSIMTGLDGGQNTRADNIIQVHACGICTFASSGQKTLRLGYKFDAGAGTINAHGVHGENNGTIGQFYTRVTARPFTQQVGPVIIGSRTAHYLYTTSNGYGSTNTHVRKYTTATTESDVYAILSLSNSSTAGVVATALKRARVCLNYADQFTSGSQFAICKNCSSFTADIDTVTRSGVVAWASTPAADVGGSLNWCGVLEIGDTLAPINSLSGTGSSTSRAYVDFTAETVP